MTTLKFKRRLALLVTATHGSQRQFAKALADIGHAVHPSTINKWIDDKSPTVPNAEDLMFIATIEPEVSIDYLLGNRKAETVSEQFIEGRLK